MLEQQKCMLLQVFRNKNQKAMVGVGETIDLNVYSFVRHGKRSKLTNNQIVIHEFCNRFLPQIFFDFTHFAK